MFENDENDWIVDRLFEMLNSGFPSDIYQVGQLINDNNIQHLHPFAFEEIIEKKKILS